MNRQVKALDQAYQALSFSLSNYPINPMNHFLSFYLSTYHPVYPGHEQAGGGAGQAYQADRLHQRARNTQEPVSILFCQSGGL